MSVAELARQVNSLVRFKPIIQSEYDRAIALSYRLCVFAKGSMLSKMHLKMPLSQKTHRDTELLLHSAM